MNEFNSYRKIASPGNKQLSYIADGFYRHFSIYVSFVLSRIGISADAITVFSVFIGISSGVLLLTDHPLSFLFAALMLHFYHLLDCADGEMARFYKSKKTDSPKTIAGGFLDFLGFVLVPPFIVFCLGLSLINAFEQHTLLIAFFSFTAALSIAGPAKITYTRVTLEAIIADDEKIKSSKFWDLLKSKVGLPGYTLPRNVFMRFIFMFANSFLPALNVHLTILAAFYILELTTSFSDAVFFHSLYVLLLFLAYLLHTVWAIIKNYRILKKHPIE